MIARLLAAAIGLNFVISAQAAELPPGKFENIHNVAIVSAIGHRLMLEHKGLFIWSNSEDILNGDDLGVDDLVTKTATRLLQNRFTIENVSYEKEDFADSGTDFFYSLDQKIKGAASKLKKDDNIDAYIVIFPDYAENPLLNGSNFFGMGLYRKLNLRIAFAFYSVAVIDAHTGKIIAEEDARAGPYSFVRNNSPVEYLDNDDWEGTKEAWTDERKARFVPIINGVIEKSLTYTLGKLNLAPDAAAAK